MTPPHAALTPSPAAVPAGLRLNSLLHAQADAMRRLDDALARYETLAQREPWLTRGYTVR
ncbi:MAG: hypothetical protein AAF800_12515 [Planctomycetota bacterium]